MKNKLDYKDHHSTQDHGHERLQGRHHSERTDGHPMHTKGRGHHPHASRRSPDKAKLKRLFERGDLQLLILVQLKQTASHGYELIKSIGQLTHGIYEPSPGVVYPTLSMLEDQGLIQQETTENSKKSYVITSEGLSHLQQHEARLTVLNDRLSAIQNTPEDIDFSKPIEEAIRNFKMLMRHQLRHAQLSQEQIEKIVSIINQATQEINQISYKVDTE